MKQISDFISERQRLYLHLGTRLGWSCDQWASAGLAYITAALLGHADTNNSLFGARGKELDQLFSIA